MAIEAMPGRGAPGDDGGEPPDASDWPATWPVTGACPSWSTSTSCAAGSSRRSSPSPSGCSSASSPTTGSSTSSSIPYLQVATTPDQARPLRHRPARGLLGPPEGVGLRRHRPRHAGASSGSCGGSSRPGLYRHERRYAVPFVASALVPLPPRRRARVLDPARGAGVPRATSAARTSIEIYSPNKYFQLIIYMMLAFGIGFEFPILLLFLQLAGIVTARHAGRVPPLRHRRHRRARRRHHAVGRPDQPARCSRCRCTCSTRCRS